MHAHGIIPQFSSRCRSCQAISASVKLGSKETATPTEPAARVRISINLYYVLKRRLLSISNSDLYWCCGKDIDECMNPSLNACVSQAKCENTNGNYTCTCNSRFKNGDGRKDGSGCKLSSRIHNIIIILPGKSYQ